ncbi:tyrosinase family domain-containing protein [Longimicrobium sp.]|jgi:hypothetical protein|uniref:tyrosinase family domain-containing protein n=1 Tax=Longimicrobium sp. TaxID=2029185 RepID=UPI002F95B4D3
MALRWLERFVGSRTARVLPGAAALAVALTGSACQAQREPAAQRPAERPAQEGTLRYVLHDPPGMLTVRGAPVVTAPFRVPGEARARLFAGGRDLPAAAASLRLEGVVLPREAGVTIDVYVNHPAANAESGTTHPAFVGSLTLMRAAADDPGDPVTVTLGVAPLVHDLLRGRDDLSVTLVPVNHEGRPSSAAFGLDRIVLVLR